MGQTASPRWGRNRRSLKVHARNTRHETRSSYIGEPMGAVELFFSDRNCGRGQRRKALCQPRRAFRVRRLKRFGFRSFGGMLRSSGRWGLRVRFPAIEPAHGVSSNRPRRDLRRFVFLALAILRQVDGAGQASFDEHVRSFLDRRRDTLCQERLLYGREPNGVRVEPGKQKPRSCRTQELARSSAQKNER